MASPNRDQYPNLRYLIEGYFHQDWDITGDTGPAVLTYIRRNEDPDVRAAVVQDVNRVLSLDLPDNELDHLLADLRLDYNPAYDGLTDRQWLELVRASLSES